VCVCVCVKEDAICGQLVFQRATSTSTQPHPCYRDTHTHIHIHEHPHAHMLAPRMHAQQTRTHRLAIAHAPMHHQYTQHTLLPLNPQMNSRRLSQSAMYSEECASSDGTMYPASSPTPGGMHAGAFMSCERQCLIPIVEVK